MLPVFVYKCSTKPIPCSIIYHRNWIQEMFPIAELVILGDINVDKNNIFHLILTSARDKEQFNSLLGKTDHSLITA